MDITIRAHNFKVGENLEEFAVKKLERLDRYLPRISDLLLELERQQTHRGEPITTAQITLRHSRGAILRAEERVKGTDHSAIEAAINASIDKMYRQISRFKGKRLDRRRRSGRYLATPEELEIAEELPENDEFDMTYEEAEAESELEIVRRKQVALTPMSEQDAIHQMELLGHDFFMFFNEATGGVNVLYKRSNGAYGVLVPDTPSN
ncbi:MAG: ribosome-associated translation inhibitor RaiA [Anaerolineae bacterium]|jgi:putative sigma-54 modulation protein|nr:ribosome-associated translation inhibitor RaiA [Anaerolineae bacterium]